MTLKDSVVNSKLGIQYFSNVYARSVWAWHSETVWEGEGGEGEGRGGEGRSLPYQSKNRSRAPDCLCIADVHRRCHRTTLLFVTLFQTRYCSADKCTNGPRQGRSRVPGTKVPCNERSRERMFQGTNSLENESSRERTVQGTKFHGTNGPENESSIMGTNVPGNE